MKYANIIVNISHESLDKYFQYVIPERLRDELSVGDYVSIPFGRGNRLIEGYVMEITDKAEFDPARLKEIAEIKTDSRLVEHKLIRLAYWMKQRYGSTMITALKTVLPIKKIIKEKENRSIILCMEDEAAYERLELYARKHQTARERLMRELINEKQLDYRLVTTKLNISAATINAMEKQEVLRVEKTRVYRNTTGEAEKSSGRNRIRLNGEQEKIASEIINEYSRGIRNTYLIHGITGSGKTEVYMEIIDAVVRQGRQVIVLIPEISLTYQTVMRFYKRFGDSVSTLHSRLSDGEKYDQFERAKKGEISVMIGPRSALFTPFEDLGLIVIDEEHESSYKSDSMPKYHARETAIELAKLHGASVVLGSATPSMEAYYRAKKGDYKLYTLDRRAISDASLPTVHIADLREELKNGNRTMFSAGLKTMMDERLEKGEQIMLFLNRRGYAGFYSCRSCGFVLKCPHCDVSLSSHEGGRLKCHYCGYEREEVKICPECGSSYIGGMRAGTQQIEESVKKLFPHASVLRMDADTTSAKGNYDKILSAFANREADILIGTQMIVKGHDFPYVTLMGILIADMSLNVGDYRASERTFQLLTQAAGRAGRAELKGDVVIQTYKPEHYAIQAASRQDYTGFYDEEILYRELMEYPPVGHMLAVMIESRDEEAADDYAKALAEVLKSDIINGLYPGKVRMIGPADATVKKINDIYRKLIYLKSTDQELLEALKDRAEELRDIGRGRILPDSDDAGRPAISGEANSWARDKRIRMTMDMDPVNGY